MHMLFKTSRYCKIVHLRRHAPKFFDRVRCRLAFLGRGDGTPRVKIFQTSTALYYGARPVFEEARKKLINVKF